MYLHVFDMMISLIWIKLAHSVDTGPKFYSAILTALAHGLKVKVKNLEILY